MKSKILKTLCILLAVVVGYCLGAWQYKESIQIYKFNSGLATFCSLNETERMMVCPRQRRASRLKTGGTLIHYRCTNSQGYVETSSLTPHSNSRLMTFFFRLRTGGLKVKEECKTDSGKIYKIEGP